jgi:DNA-binding LacI/PurR family transcriptional regulator
MRQIAAHCRVATSTVQRALAGKTDEVSERTLRRVLAAAEELGYNPNHHFAARRLFANRTTTPILSQTLSLVFPDVFFTMNFFLAMFRGVLEELNRVGYSLVTSTYCSYTQEQFPVPNVIQRGDVDGVIFYGHPHTANTLAAHLRAEVNFADRPLVSLLFPALPNMSAVMVDDWGGAYAVMSHLLELGHRAVAHCLTGNLSYQEQQRLGAYRQACTDHGLDGARVLRPVEFTRQSPMLDVHYVPPLLATLHAHPEITAVMMPNDPSAVAVWEGLEAAGYRIPQDISLVGYDDTDPLVGGQQRNNLLTTLRLPLDEVGREAARLTIGRSTGAITSDRTSLLPTELVVRQSTAPPRTPERT